jgi:hypothetical protein
LRLKITELLFGDLGFTEFFADAQARKFNSVRERTFARAGDATTRRRDGDETDRAEAAFLLSENAFRARAFARRARATVISSSHTKDHNYSSHARAELIASVHARRFGGRMRAKRSV